MTIGAESIQHYEPVVVLVISKDISSLRQNREEMLLIMNKKVKAPDDSSLSVKYDAWTMKMEGFHMGDFKQDISDTLAARDWKDPPPSGVDKDGW